MRGGDAYHNSNGDLAFDVIGGELTHGTDVTGFRLVTSTGTSYSSGDVGQYFLYGWKIVKEIMNG